MNASALALAAIRWDSDDQFTLHGERFIRAPAKPYYSAVRMTAARSGGDGEYIYSIASGAEVAAFSYAYGKDMATAGRSGVTATYSDTNLEDDRRTNSGEVVLIEGLGIEIMGLSDPELARLAARDLTVWVERGASDKTLLGHITEWPCGRGFSGLQETRVGDQPLGGGRPLVGQFQNGAPLVDNLRKLPQIVPWTPQGRGASSFSVKLKAERAIDLATTVKAATAGAGIYGYAAPATLTVMLEFMVRLDCAVFVPAS